MRILLAADGSSFTRKALDFLAAHEALWAGAELVVLHVQPDLPPQVKGLMGAAAVSDYQRSEATKVLAPIESFLQRQGAQFRATWAVGTAGHEIVEASRREGADLIVMGTHGYGLLGRTVMGSVAQRVVTESDIPVLLVK